MTLKEYVVSHIVNLIKIKSVVTLALTSAFVVLSLKGEIAPDQFLMIFTTVIAFYFGTQKKDEAKETSTSPAETSTIAEAPTETVDVPTEHTNTPTESINIPSEIQYDAVYEPTEEGVSR